LFASTITQAADTTTFNDPVWLAPDIGGTNVLIADQNNSQVYECGPGFTTTCGSGVTVNTGVNGPSSVAEDGLGNLYVANNGGNNLTSYVAGAFTGAATTISTNGNTPFKLAVLP
jgi:diaminopimelate epimerase